VALTGLALYAATGTEFVGPLLAIHLATVVVLFLLSPSSKMVHGFFRLAALVAEAASPNPWAATIDAPQGPAARGPKPDCRGASINRGAGPCQRQSDG